MEMFPGISHSSLSSAALVFGFILDKRFNLQSLLLFDLRGLPDLGKLFTDPDV